MGSDPALIEMRYELRSMTIADLGQVVAIEQESFRKPWSRASFENELGVPFSEARVAVPEDRPERIAGYLVRWHVADEIHLLDVAVSSEFRGTGLGRHLILDLLDEADALGAGRVFLEVSATNAPALRLYQSLGFHEVQRRSAYYGPGDDALVLEHAATLG